MQTSPTPLPSVGADLHQVLFNHLPTRLPARAQQPANNYPPIANRKPIIIHLAEAKEGQEDQGKEKER
jgi:hypothetical protein